VYRLRTAPIGLSLGAVLASLSIGCAAPGPRGLLADLPRAHAISDVPFFPQEEAECGPAALAMALRHAGAEVDPEDLSPMVFTRARRGSFQFDLVGAARRNGHVPYPVVGWQGLFAEVSAGRPVVVLQNLGFDWLPFWHFAVLIGFDRDAGTVTLHTGTREARSVPTYLFARTWRRASHWARVVLPPSELPELLGERSTLEAIAALEGTAEPTTSERAYAAVVERWPASGPAHLGLGNVRYRRGDLAGAEAAWRAGLEATPDFIPTLNNLAHLLGETGRSEEARALLESRLDGAGPWRPVLLRTLEGLDSTR